MKKQLARKPGTGAPTKPGGSAQKPRVDLSRLIAAAKKDPGAQQGHVTCMAGVNLVEAALVKLGYLGRTYAGDDANGTQGPAASRDR